MQDSGIYQIFQHCIIRLFIHRLLIYHISDLFVNGSVSLPSGSLVISSTVKLQNALNTQQDNITLLDGTHVTITESPIDTWAINSVDSGGTNYTNTHKYLVIDNNADTINLSNHISVTDISSGNKC